MSNMHQTCVSQVFLQFSTQFIMNKTNAAVSIIVRANPEGLKQQISDFTTGIGWNCSE